MATARASSRYRPRQARARTSRPATRLAVVAGEVEGPAGGDDGLVDPPSGKQARRVGRDRHGRGSSTAAGQAASAPSASATLAEGDQRRPMCLAKQDPGADPSGLHGVVLF